ncbi:MAG TPA: diacylglycerol kinase family protein [Streptosporangiaceae bacterium]|nr:diacylglycerol kinase family protein [Streptosporangiaceae bacterium]
MLIVNPHATSTTALRRDVIARALASELDLTVVQTRYRGHAAHFAGEAAKGGYDLVLTLGGDGTVNEAVNGLLHASPSGGPDARPALATVPGGSANVFTRALGMPPDPVDATGRILAALTGGGSRTIGLGLAQDRYFTVNAGLGFDAEVVRAIEGLRADGQEASAGLYVWTAIRHFYGVTNRRQPALTLERDGRTFSKRLFFAIVSNAAPWTYLGSRPVNPSPEARFDAGLDVYAVYTLATLPTLGTLRHMLGIGHGWPGGPDGPGGSTGLKHALSLHDERELTFRASRPIAFQVDGEYVGEREQVTFCSVPDALRIIA